MTFVTGQILTAAELNALGADSITTAGGQTIAGGLTVSGDLVSGTLYVTGADSSSGPNSGYALYVANDLFANFVGGNTIGAGSCSVSGSFTPPAYTVAALPTGTVGQIAYASNGRNSGEAAGAGTGTMVSSNNSGAWLALWSGLAVTA